MTGQKPSVPKSMHASKWHSNMVIHNINVEILNNFFVFVCSRPEPPPIK